MPVVTLREIATVQAGYSFRSGLELDQSGTLAVIQMKDLGEDGVVDITSLACVAVESPKAQWVRIGDIILRSRGDRATSAIILDDPGHAVAAAPLLRVRVEDERILPAYINWFMNQPPAQAHFAQRAEGSNVKMITKNALEDLEVALPPLDRQRKIIELTRLRSRERTLDDAVDRLRFSLLSDLMMAYARKDPVL